MKEQFINKNFRDVTLTMILVADKILSDFYSQGYILTLRQLYYQFVAADMIPNNEKSYGKLGNVINKARLAGLINWSHMEDRTRNARSNPHWDNPSEILDSAASSYRRDKWENQTHRIEVWVEKDALIGIVGDISSKLDVTCFSCRGYTSQSEMYSAGKRLDDYILNDQIPVVLHLGDHDPSGIDMSRDIEERLSMFLYGNEFEFKRIALTMEQIEELNPPPNPAKFTDSRYREYVHTHSTESCWELDALNPNYMTDLIERNILRYREEEKWEEMITVEETERSQIEEIAESFK